MGPLKWLILQCSMIRFEQIYILFMLFTGFFPSKTEDADGNETTDFSAAKEKMSATAYKLLQSIVNPSPTERYSIDDILSHEWIAGKKENRARKMFRKLSYE